MYRTNAVFLYSIDMLPGPVSLVSAESVGGVFLSASMMRRSLVTLAMMDAAAMERLSMSP